MLFRKCKKEIVNWYYSDINSALLVTGARQVGKTFLIEQTLIDQNINYAKFNLIENSALKNSLNTLENISANEVILRLKFAANKKLNKGDVIFIDEVQEVKELVTIIKFLVEEGSFKYILSGSLLGVELTDLKSAPVGYLSILEMYPLDFEEFLIANNISNETINYLKDCFDNIKPVDKYIHNSLIDTFYKYLIVGGMPQAVDNFIKTQDLNSVINIQKSIISLYKNDFTKYEKEKKLELIKTYDLIPSELNSKNKRYTFTNLDQNLRFEKYVNNFNWLIDAGVAIPTYNVTEYQIPLMASKKSNLFKLFLSDVGLLTCSYGLSTAQKLLDKGKEINCGAIFENFVAIELNSHKLKTYYFNNKKHGEVDFLLEYETKLLPVEVKSGKDYQTHSALSYFMSTNYFSKAFVLSNSNVSIKNNIIYLPIYMTMFIQEQLKESTVKKIDLSNLTQHIKTND